MINRRFEIVKHIGKGRSEVFLCKDLDNNSMEVAVKFLAIDVEIEEILLFRIAAGNCKSEYKFNPVFIYHTIIICIVPSLF